MALYDAARRGPKQSVVDSVMTGDASYESTFKAALSVGKANTMAEHLIIARIFAPKLEDSFRATINKAGYDDARINTL